VLRRELPGYAEYVGKVRWRVIESASCPRSRPRQSTAPRERRRSRTRNRALPTDPRGHHAAARRMRLTHGCHVERCRAGGRRDRSRRRELPRLDQRPAGRAMANAAAMPHERGKQPCREVRGHASRAVVEATRRLAREGRHERAAPRGGHRGRRDALRRDERRRMGLQRIRAGRVAIPRGHLHRFDEPRPRRHPLRRLRRDEGAWRCQRRDGHPPLGHTRLDVHGPRWHRDVRHRRAC
jgi:hypothetical protein